MKHKQLSLQEALASDRLEDFVRQAEACGVELVSGSELERALALLITQHRSAVTGQRDRPRHRQKANLLTSRLKAMERLCSEPRLFRSPADGL